jgi:hypothetical protein
MKKSTSCFRTAAKIVLILLLGFAAFAPVPARAQIMHEDGVPIPWFHSRSEKLARQACMQNLPECRDSVRQKLATELMITNLAPWVMICLIVLGAVMYVRIRDAKREARRQAAQRHHAQTAASRPPRDERPRDRKGRHMEPAPEEDEII